MTLQLTDDGALSVRDSLTVACIKLHAGTLQTCVLPGVVDADACFGDIICGFINVHFRHCATFEAARITLQLTFRRNLFNACLVDRFQRCRAVELRIQCSARHLCIETGQRCLFLRKQAAQFRAVDFRDDVTLLHGVTGHDVQRHDATADGIQARTVCSDHATFCRNVAHEITAGDCGDAQAFFVHAPRTAQPRGGGPTDQCE